MEDQAEQYCNEGFDFLEREKYSEALVSFDKAINLNPNYEKGWYGRGTALGFLEKFEEALAPLDKAVTINPDFAKAWNNRGLVLDNLKQYEEALASYDKAIAINPDFPLTWINHGYVQGNLGQFNEALQDFDKAIAIDPEDTLAWSNRGWVLIRLGRFEESIAACDKAIKLDPNEPNSWINRGIARRELERSLKPVEGEETVSEDPKDSRRHIPPEVKAAVWERDSGKCVLCGSTQQLEYDHNIPFSRGGSNTMSNIRILCKVCNRRKSKKIE